MAGRNDHSSRKAWRLAEKQRALITHAQLLGLGFTRHAIAHRVERGRLHPIHRGVYAVGRPQLTRAGEIMAAVLACGPGAAASHETAAERYGIRRRVRGPIHVSRPSPSRVRIAGVKTHRRSKLEVQKHDGIPLTSPVQTLIDLATTLSERHLLAAVNEADKLDLIDPEALRTELERWRRVRGVGRLKRILDRLTYRMTRSELERRLLSIAQRAGLDVPETNVVLNGYEVDFYWPDLGLVVETDGFRYHRTPAQQAADALRDQAHLRAGLTPLRVPEIQIAFEPRRVEQTLAVVAARLGADAA